MSSLICSTCSYLSLMLFCLPPLHAENVKLREEAVELINRSIAVSHFGGLRDYRQEVKFRVREADGSIREGVFTRLSAGAAGNRDEITFGGYHSVRVIVGNRQSETHTAEEPPEIRELRRQLPVHLGRFDQQDVINSILESNVLGRNAKCINFDTHFGDTIQTNQICLDTERGSILRWQVGREVIENTEYFQISSLWEPGHIRRFLDGQLQFEIEQQITAMDTPVDPTVFAPPSPSWQTFTDCKNMRPAIATSTPMPPPGNAGTGIIDVVVHGYIWSDGSVREPQIESSSRPDLNEEALKIVTRWKYLPLLCNDKVAVTTSEFVVHFQDR
jgi:hypothetical protein